MNTFYFFDVMKRVLFPLMGVVVIFLSNRANAQVYRDRDNDGLIEISFIETLDSIRYNLTGACSSGTCNGYELTRGLDFNERLSYRDTTGKLSAFTKGSGWNPIGDNSTYTNVTRFNTTFEGNGYNIDHLYINRSSIGNIGLFGYTGNNSRIRNIGITNVSVSGENSVGGLVGFNYEGTITQSYVTGNVTGSSHSVGGLVGWNTDGIITQSYATGNVTGSSDKVGGLVGNNRGLVTQSYATGNVIGSSNSVGGLAGNNSGTITQSYATGNVTGSSSHVGGLVGNHSGTITHGYWNKDASQTVGGSARSNSNKLGIGSGSSGTFVSGLTLSALQSPTANASDSIQELGPGFIYKQGQLPKIHLGARVSVKGVNFTQTVPSITNIVTSSSVANITQGTATTRATLTVDGIAFTANLIEVRNITTPYTITDIQNGVKMPQAITFSALGNKIYGDAPFVLSATSSAGLTVSFSASNTLVSININTITINGAGTVSITAYQTGNAEFNPANSVSQVLFISPAPVTKQNQTITFGTLPSKTFGDAPFVLNATSSAGLSVSYSSSNTAIASINGSSVTINGAGTVNMTAFQIGNENYLPASATQILTVVNKTGTTTPTPTGTTTLTFVETFNTSIHIFPNPANDYITIPYDKTQKVSSVKVYDMTGKNYELKMNHYELGMKADVKNLPKGEYILVIYGEKGEVLKTEKVIKK